MATSGTPDEGRETPTADLYIKPKVVIEPDFTLHHHDVDHTAANFGFSARPDEIHYNPDQNSLYFDGSSSNYASITNSELDFTPDDDARSYSVWVKKAAPTGPGAHELIFEHANPNPTTTPAGIGIRLKAYYGYLEIPYDTLGTFSSLDTVNLANNEWHHIVLTMDPVDPDGSNQGTMRAYVDGALIGTRNIYTSAEFTGTLNLGRSRIANYGFTGYVDEFSYWTKTLTETEVEELYGGGGVTNLSNHSAVANLKLWWKLGSNITDYSGNGYHGTLNAGTYQDDAPPLPVDPHEGTRQPPFSKRFQLIRGAGAGRTTMG